MFGSNEHRAHDIEYGFLTPYSTTCVRNSGVWFDNNLTFDKLISTVVKSCFYHLSLLTKVKPFLSLKKFEMFMHTFVISRLDYCKLWNSLLIVSQFILELSRLYLLCLLSKLLFFLWHIIFLDLLCKYFLF